jgi:hypothetical protein
MRSFAILAGCLFFGCSGNNNSSSTADAGTKIADAPLGADGSGTPDAKTTTGGGTDGGGLVNDAGQPLCQSKGGGLVVCACSDGIDNDGDHLVDALDPECVGPYDNDEATFATGIPGDNSDPNVQDCFFDGDSGGGNDHCRWDIRCIDPPNGQYCNNQQLDGCEKCKPLVPNGCDCFGCCDVYVNGVVHTVRLTDTCTTAVIDDPLKCPTCTKVAQCQNTCEMCEVCIGHEPDPSCSTTDAGVPVGQCPSGIDPCQAPDNTCPPEKKCVTGCCQPFLQ